jgi:hypothetical protein
MDHPLDMFGSSFGWQAMKVKTTVPSPQPTVAAAALLADIHCMSVADQ